MPTTVNASVAAELRDAAARKNLSGRQVARNARMESMYVHRRLSGVVELSVEDLVFISRGIGVEPLDLFAQALMGLEITETPAVAGTT